MFLKHRILLSKAYSSHGIAVHHENTLLKHLNVLPRSILKYDLFNVATQHVHTPHIVTFDLTHVDQCNQIGRIFAYWMIVCFGWLQK
jgi:hypothetical protein